MSAPFEDRLTKLLDLKANWDSYDAPTIGHAAVARASQVEVRPTVRGGIELSWFNEELSIEFDTFGNIESVCWDRSGTPK